MEQAPTLAGKVAVVTGAGSKGVGFGTGKATAVLLAHAGAHIVLVDRHDDRARDTKRIITEEGGRASVVVVDLASEADCRHVVEEAVGATGRLDILINNAAAFAPGNIFDTTEETLERVIRGNLKVPFMMSKAALPVMVGGGGGSILFMSSIVAIRGPGPPVYAMAKAGLAGLTVSLATTFGTQGVRVNTVIPGIVDTPMRTASVAAAGIDEPQLNVGRSTATGTAGDAWDIAHTVLFLCSPEAKHVTGVMMPVDGGASTMMR